MAMPFRLRLLNRCEPEMSIDVGDAPLMLCDQFLHLALPDITPLQT